VSYVTGINTKGAHKSMNISIKQMESHVIISHPSRIPSPTQACKITGQLLSHSPEICLVNNPQISTIATFRSR
jgi:hypothetical protein